MGQLTSGNTATVLQTGTQSSGNLAVILQNAEEGGAFGGGNNTALIQQETNAPESPSTTSYSTSNIAYIMQLGDNSYADIKQQKDADDNRAEIYQYSGTGSDARIQQEFEATSQNDALINQHGNNQLAYAAQIKASNNRLTIDQGSANMNSSTNKAYVFQSFSNDGVVAIRQNTGAGSNTATVGQSGNNNFVKGPGLLANVTVPGFRPDVPIGALQDGLGNKMIVTQSSPGSMNGTIVNTADLAQRGNNNTLSVEQTATTVGNSTTISQTGNLNQAVVQQNGMIP